MKVDEYTLQDVVFALNDLYNLVVCSKRRAKLLVRYMNELGFKEYSIFFETIHNILCTISNDVHRIGKQVVSEVEEEYRKGKKE